MPGTMPATSQLDWLISITAMIVLFWSRATRDLLKSFGWGIAPLHRIDAATKLPSLAARPIASIGPAANGTAVGGPPKSILAISDLTFRWFHLSCRRPDRQRPAEPFAAAGPRVRILFPPAGSLVRTVIEAISVAA